MLFGECVAENLFQLWDPDASPETEFEMVVVRALSCIYPNYHCFVFTGSFRYDDRLYKPDLALVAKDFSHWFVIEVELTSHSFEKHVLPQVRAFQYGDFQPDCVSILSRELGVDDQRAATLLHFVPRSVAVIANKWNQDWALGLRALTIQFLAISLFRSSTGSEALEVDGSLEVVSAHLGFGTYSAVDRALVFPADIAVPEGEVQINDPEGGLGTWDVKRASSLVWFTKSVGLPDLVDKSQVQLVRTVSGGLSMRRPELRSRIQRLTA